jgi:glutathione peroxidase-family protein
LFGTQAIKWNFSCFLVNRRGRPVARFGPLPWLEAAVAPRIEHLLLEEVDLPP